MKLYTGVATVIAVAGLALVSRCEKVTPIGCYGGQELYYATIKRGGIRDRKAYDAEYAELKTRCFNELQIVLK